MYFKEFLRVRTVLLWYVAVLVVLTVFIEIVALISPESMQGDFEQSPWVLLFIGAGFMAAIVATVLGSTLAQEHAHLEVAWTRPKSRTTYATTLMAVDAAGILAAQLIAFAFIIAHYAMYHRNVHLVSGPDDALNIARFVLFPIAWYALIVALSASLSRAGLVQGLIWPIALVLAVLAAAPLPDVWHGIVAVINVINPMAYVTGHDNGGTQIGAALPNVTLAVAALALIAAASWFAATYQWRRLQA